MDNWTEWLLFVFFLVLAGTGFFLLYFRLMRVEERLRQDRASGQIQAQIRALSDGLEQLDIRPMESYLFEMKEILGRLEKKWGQSTAATAEASDDAR